MDEFPMTPDPLNPAREDGVALWRQIVRVLESEIADATHPPGARLPTEAQLSQRFAVNRHTVRRALEEMSRNGLVRVEQGRGSFVAEDVLDYTIGPRTRFSEWVRRHNKEPSGQVLDLRETPADATIAAGLGLRAGARVVRLERLGLADGRPVSLGSHHFPAARFPGLLAALRGAPTITEALATCGVSDYRRQVTRVTARMPQPQEAELLRMPRNRPLLVTENVNVDQAGVVVEFGIARYPTPRVQIVFEP
ncbi:MAG: phosphonate metabolism transcriptional regulator PhnF [Rhodospirillales bacterium]|nr:phosphonate metabolism transcriptional regulator PhnF [Rhodospirillales bacterium]